MSRALSLMALLMASTVAGWGYTVAITVPNGSFESPNINTGTYPNYTGATGEYWYRVVVNPGTGAGSAGPRQLPIGGAPYVSGVHDQAAGVGRNSALYHTGVDLSGLPGGGLFAGTYTLTYDLGIRSDQTTPRPTGYTIEVWGLNSVGSIVGSAALGSYSFVFPSNYDWTGRWNDDLAFSFVAATNPSITQLQIRLINDTAGAGISGSIIGGTNAAQLLFDRIRLEGDLVPEPSTYALMSTVGLALYWLRRRKTPSKG